MTSENGEDLDRYSVRVQRRIAQRLMGPPIELILGPIDFGSSDSPLTTLGEMLDSDPAVRIALLGNPGAGKSTVVGRACTAMLDERPLRRIPVIVELRRYMIAGLSLEDLINAERDQILEEVGDGPGQLGMLVLDGLNEVQAGMMHLLLDEIEDVCSRKQLDNVPVVLTCRTIDFPAAAAPGFLRFEVQPITPEQAQSMLSVRFGGRRARSIWRGLSWETRELCSVPMLLAMLMYVFDRHLEGTEQLAPQTRDELYQLFLTKLDERTMEKVALETPSDIRWSCLAYVAFVLDNAVVEVPLIDAQRALTASFESSWGVPVQVLQREVLDHPPMGASVTAKGGAGQTRAFMHQSFQEYFAARHIASGLRSSSLEIADLHTHVESAAEGWHETIGFLSGMLADASELVAMAWEAGSHRLAALCVSHANAVDADLVDRMCMEHLDAFKYGDAFDYSKILTLAKMMPKRSGGFPDRVQADIAYWRAKYERVTPRELELVCEADLIGLLKDGTRYDRLNAIWTLGLRVSERGAGVTDEVLEETVQILEWLARDNVDPGVREQSLVALGRISPSSAFELFSHVALDQAESRWLRSYAVHGLGSYASEETVAMLLALIRDEDLRDDASWALSLIADREPDVLVDSLDELVDVLHLPNVDCYTKGCLLFVLGAGRYSGMAQPIVEYLMHERNPYVLEDGCHALGMLGDPMAVPFLSSLSQMGDWGDDVVVQRHARKALESCTNSGTGV